MWALPMCCQRNTDNGVGGLSKVLVPLGGIAHFDIIL